MSEQNHPDAPINDADAPVEATQPNSVNLTPEEIEKLQSDNRINLEGWQRARAEFANYKKRTEKEMKNTSERGALEALKKILPMVDDFARALDNIPEELKGNPWVNGTSLILKKFDKLMEEYAIQEVDPVGQPFDPYFHEAIGMDDSDEYASGTVTVTLQKGYVSGDRVLRPALVRVAN
jgi:molecular chaperone GrpE